MIFPVWRYHVFAGKITWYFIGVYIIEMDLYLLLFLSLTFGSSRRSTLGAIHTPKIGSWNNWVECAVFDSYLQIVGHYDADDKRSAPLHSTSLIWLFWRNNLWQWPRPVQCRAVCVNGKGGVKWDLSPLLAHPLWVSLRPVKLIKIFRSVRFFPHLRPARWTYSRLWNGNPNYGFWSWHKATCYFRGLLETASSTASFGRTSLRGRILTNTSKFVKVIASVECDLGILATLTEAWMLLSLTSFIFDV